MKSSKLFVGILLLIYATVLTTVYICKANPFLWFDEAGQFWISKGLNHYSDPLVQEKGVIAVVESNSQYNMDPGGFGILLHFWSKASDSYVWLRLLPYLFFVLLIAVVVSLSWQWTGNREVALLCGFIPLFVPLLLNLATELRAFSMEALGTVAGVLILERLKDRISVKRVFIAGLIFSFFMTSRYAAIMPVFIYSLAVLYFVFVSALAAKQKLIAAIAYAAPVLATVAFIYFFSLSVQNPAVEPMFYLPYIGSDKTILLKPENIAYLGALAILFIMLLLSGRIGRLKKYRLLLVLTVSVNLLFIILSFLNKHPWAPFSARCISLFLLMLLCLVALAAELLVFLKMNIWIAIVILLAGLFIRRHSFRTMQRPANLYTDLKKTDLRRYSKIYAGSWASPSLRYLFEYGRLKSEAKGLYPDRFVIGGYGRHDLPSQPDAVGTHQLSVNDFLQYDLLIAPESIDTNVWTLVEGTSELFRKRN